MDWEPVDMAQACPTVQPTGAHPSEVPLRLPATVWPIVKRRHLEVPPARLAHASVACVLCHRSPCWRVGPGGGAESAGAEALEGEGLLVSSAVSDAPRCRPARHLSPRAGELFCLPCDSVSRGEEPWEGWMSGIPRRWCLLIRPSPMHL